MLCYADVCVRGQTVRALRACGVNVLLSPDNGALASDETILGDALRLNRVLVTEDRDFGELVFAKLKASPPVIYIRRVVVTDEEALDLARVIAGLAPDIEGWFITIDDHGVRRRALPQATS